MFFTRHGRPWSNPTIYALTSTSVELNRHWNSSMDEWLLPLKIWDIISYTGHNLTEINCVRKSGSLYVIINNIPFKVKHSYDLEQGTNWLCQNYTNVNMKIMYITEIYHDLVSEIIKYGYAYVRCTWSNVIGWNTLTYWFRWWLVTRSMPNQYLTWQRLIVVN